MGDLERALVKEMISYKRQFEAVRDASSHELSSFWLRKTGKAVVAVLVTQKPGEAPVFWRGLNVEVWRRARVKPCGLSSVCMGR